LTVSRNVKKKKKKEIRDLNTDGSKRTIMVRVLVICEVDRLTIAL
jgi:hypothetical protein